MGLDQFLEYKRVAAGVNWVQEVGYWRRANAVHKWFVDNVQNGNDDCEEYFVSTEQLQKLYDLCVEVLDSKSVKLAVELLPPAANSDQIDEKYWSDLQKTVNILKPLVTKRHPAAGSFYYSSSW